MRAGGVTLKRWTCRKGRHSGHCTCAIIYAPPSLVKAIVHTSCIKTNSLLLQLSCILTSIHYMGKRITINFANDILGFDVDFLTKFSTWCFCCIFL